MLAVLRLAAEAGAAASWILIFIALTVAVFTLYIGIAMWATLRASDPEQRKIGYEVFRELLRFLKDWWRR